MIWLYLWQKTISIFSNLCICGTLIKLKLYNHYLRTSTHATSTSLDWHSEWDRGITIHICVLNSFDKMLKCIYILNHTSASRWRTLLELYYVWKQQNAELSYHACWWWHNGTGYPQTWQWYHCDTMTKDNQYIQQPVYMWIPFAPNNA